ncbi:ATP-binding protein [Nostoc flagelliforme FACHB-838]|uniref:ATP-binding protein n=1 Tax=Nostoc flagelliforme FACHB-838 TaxID=2692904 RepID=A0ABR8E088_9NOSO|nr:tetratricopeptide repeat protein [Nostoc flagelliforme]MBD2533984.1 ATP-binding protein [Nostoc flagelliforme FACHB-838]
MTNKSSEENPHPITNEQGAFDNVNARDISVGGDITQESNTTNNNNTNNITITITTSSLSPQQDNETEQSFAQKDQQNYQVTSSSTKKTIPPNNLNTHPSNLDEDYFVGREAILEELKQALENKNNVFITGRSGVGKSELARQYAQKHRALYPGGIWYIDALKKDIFRDLEQGYRKILKEDISAPDDEIDKKLNFYCDRWNNQSSEERVLIILDHFTEKDYNYLKPYLSNNEKLFKVLVITLDGDWTGIKSKTLNVLEQTASIKFLSLYQEDEVKNNGQIAEQICNHLENLPLVLEYVANSLMPTYDIKKICEQIKNINIIFSNDEKINSIFELDWQHLNTETKIFSCLLSLASFTPIPVALGEALAEKFDVTEWGTLSSKEMRKVLPILVKRYMIKKIPGNTHQFHPIVQYFLRYKLVELNKDRDILDLIQREFPELSQDVNVLIKKMEQLFCQVIAEEARKSKILPNPTQNDLEEFKYFIPHIIRVVTDMEPNLEDEDLVDLFTCLGRHYQDNGHYTEAINQYKECLKIIKERLGEQHPYIFKIQNALAYIYLLSEEYEKAESPYTEALEGGKRWLEENPDSSQYRETELNFAISKDYLGYLYLCLYLRHKFCNENEAKLFLNKAELLLKEAEKLFAEEKPNAEYQDDIPRNLDHLAMFHRLQKQWNKAEEFYKKALEIREGQQKEHPILAESYHNSATNYFDWAIFYSSTKENEDNEKAKQNYKKAEELYLKALEIKKKFYGKKNIKVAKTLDQLAKTYEGLCEDDKAIEKYKEALDIRKTIWDKHLDVAENMKNLADCYLYKENYEYSYEYAKDWFRQALDLMESIEKSKDWKRLIQKIYDELDYLRESDINAESLFKRASNLLGSSLDSSSLSKRF